MKRSNRSSSTKSRSLKRVSPSTTPRTYASTMSAMSGVNSSVSQRLPSLASSHSPSVVVSTSRAIGPSSSSRQRKSSISARTFTSASIKSLQSTPSESLLSANMASPSPPQRVSSQSLHTHTKRAFATASGDNNKATPKQPVSSPDGKIPRSSAGKAPKDTSAESMQKFSADMLSGLKQPASDRHVGAGAGDHSAMKMDAGKYIKSGPAGNVNIYNKAALLTKYDSELAERLRSTEKIIRPKPTTPGKRHLVRIDRSELWSGRPIRSLTIPKLSTGGRNTYGRITTRGRGGGTKRRLRIVDLRRSILDIPGTVERLEYDPNRSAHLALIKYPDGRMQYIVATQGMGPGDTVIASRKGAVDISPGNAMPLKYIPLGTILSCLEMHVGHGSQVARSAGVSCELISKETSSRKNYGLVKMSSGEIRLFHLDCLATVGAVSNPLYHVRSLGKAGRRRWFGHRPVTRGLARNPVDHPHGGGAGKGRPGRPSISFSGVLAKGFKTRRKNKPSPFIHTSRHTVRAVEL